MYDCHAMQKQKVTLELTMADVLNVYNGLITLIDGYEKDPENPMCERCKDNAVSLSKILDKMIEESCK